MTLVVRLNFSDIKALGNVDKQWPNTCQSARWRSRSKTERHRTVKWWTHFDNDNGIYFCLFSDFSYNPNSRPMLEDYVQYQIDNRFYDFDANMALLKMYQFDPTHFNGDCVANILLLALTNLPKSDFLLCKYLLDSRRVKANQFRSSWIPRICLLEVCRQ